MVSLRKLFLIPAALVLVASVASAAIPAINCVAVPATGVLKSEGRTEKVSVSFNCGVTGAAVTTVGFNISVFTNGAGMFTNVAGTFPVATPGTMEPTLTGTEVTTPATSITVSPNVITFNDVILQTTAAGPFTLKIDNVLVDATGIPQGSSLGLSLLAVSLNSVAVDSAIFGTVAAPSPVLTLPTVAITLKSLNVSDVYSLDPKATFPLLACQTDPAIDLTTIPAATQLFDKVKFSPVLSTSFNQTIAGGLPLVGAVPSHIAVSFGNIPAGVTLYVPLKVGTGATTYAAGTSELAELLTGYNTTTLAGGFLANLTAGATDLLFPVPASGVVVYQVTDPGSGTAFFEIPVYAVANGPVLAGAVNVMAGYAPVGGTAVPRYMPLSTVSTGFATEGPCAATLFFPYVVAGGGYDTGIAISSSGVFGDASKAASGQCVISFMGKGAPMTTKTLDVTVGQTNAFDIVGSMPTANFYGYAVAKCNFLNATGYAYVANSTGGTASYLPFTNKPVVAP